MATETALRRAVRLVAGALTQYAQEQGWRDEDYWIYYSINPHWGGRVHFVFVARGFDGRDDYESYRSVWRHLQRVLADEPDVLESLNLVVLGKNKVDEGGAYSIGPEYEDFKEFWTVIPS
jgi:hypothetical protein